MDLPSIECNLREWRDTKGVTLEEVAGLSGLSASFLSRIERGQKNPQPMTKLRLARALGVPVATLFPISSATTEQSVADVSPMGSAA